MPLDFNKEQWTKREMSRTSGKPPLPPSAAASVAAARVALGVRKPCAACKHQRRLCTTRCPLSPYFPADEPPEDFNNVQRLFNIDWVARMVKNAPPDSRDDTAYSIIYEANMRANNPVGGCRGAIRELVRRIEACKAELRMVKERIASFKNQEKMLPLKKRKVRNDGTS